SEQAAGVLRVVVRITAAAAVSHADIQVTVGSETDGAAVVVRVGLFHLEDDARVRVRIAGRVRVRAAFHDDGVFAGADGVHIVQAVFGKPGVKGESKQPAFIVPAFAAQDLEAGELGLAPAVTAFADALDASGLFDDKELAGLCARDFG